MRILIVIPRSYNKKEVYKEYPLGAGYIGTILLNMGHEVKLIDQNVEFCENDDLVCEIVKFAPSLIGFSILTATYPTALEIINLLKKNKIRTTLFAGGIHPTLFPEDCINENFDFVIKGEGEIVIQKFIQYLEGKISIDDVPNIAYKNYSGIIINKPMEKICMDVNSIPFVDRNLFNLNKYSNHSISGTRGCPFSCKFCCSYSNLSSVSFKKRMRTTENIIKEIKYILDNFENKDFFFTDDVFFSKKSNLQEFVRLIKLNNIKINFNAQLRVNMITDDVCRLLIEAGCKKIEVGVESGSQKILDGACKGIKIDDIIRGISIAKNNGIRIKTNWIYGLPGSMEEQYKAIDLMIKTKPNEISVHQLIPFPGTEYYNNRSEYGIIIQNPKDFKSFCYGDLDDNIIYKYMDKHQYIKLVNDTIVALEDIGYISSDCGNEFEYIYSTPFNKFTFKPIL